MRFRLILVGLALTSCAKTRTAPLDALSASQLTEAALDPSSLGERVYDGRVQQRSDDGQDLFRYERRVADADGVRVSSHLTFTPDEVPIILHQAVSSPDYALRQFTEIHGQTGMTGQLTVDSDGSTVFETSLGDETLNAVEGPGDPVHVGPTLFGFALQHWDALLEGDTEHLRFAVMEQQRTYRFALTLESTDASTTVFQMTATHPLVRLAVPTGRLTFDTGSRTIQRYEGLVPPMTGTPDDLRKLEARVDYALVSETYR